MKESNLGTLSIVDNAILQDSAQASVEDRGMHESHLFNRHIVLVLELFNRRKFIARDNSVGKSIRNEIPVLFQCGRPRRIALERLMDVNVWKSDERPAA